MAMLSLLDSSATGMDELSLLKRKNDKRTKTGGERSHRQPPIRDLAGRDLVRPFMFHRSRGFRRDRGYRPYRSSDKTFCGF
jgi:hypothetical protein